MATLQVKGMNDSLYEALRRRAELDCRSISQEVISIIQAYLSKPVSTFESNTYEFLKLSGAWEDSKSAKDIASSMRRARKNRKASFGDADVFD